MNPISVKTSVRLDVTYSLHEARHPVSDDIIALHHGICHSREQFLPLIGRLNDLGIHAATIDQQSENAGRFRNCIGAAQYRTGMAAAVEQIRSDHPGLRIGSYALHSMGALIGEEMQQKHPELRRPTVLMAPIPIAGALPITLRILRRRPLSYLKAVLTLDIHSLAKTPEHVRELFFDRFTPEPIVEETTTQLKHAPFWMYCQLVLRCLVRPRIRDDGLPKMLLFSDSDEIFHPQEYKRTIRRFGDLELHRIAGGHDFFLEYAEGAAERIADFHKRHSAKAAAASRLDLQPHISLHPRDRVKGSSREQRMKMEGE